MAKQHADKPEIPPVPTGDLPRWAIENYPDAVADMTSDIQSAIFWSEVPKLTYLEGKKLKQKPKDVTDLQWYAEVLNAQPNIAEQQIINSRLAAIAMTEGVTVASGLADKAERATMLFLYESKKNFRYRNTNSEYSTFEEFLLDKLPYLADKPSERSNILFLIKNMLPLMSELGVGAKAADILNHEGNYIKVRESVPYMRKATTRFELASTAYDDEIQEVNKKISKKNGKIEKTAPGPVLDLLIEEVKELKLHLEHISNDQEIVKEEAKKLFKDDVDTVLRAIADPSIPATGPAGISKVLQRGGDKVIFKGSVAIVPKHSVFYFAVSPEYQQAVEACLQTFMTFRVVGGNEILKQAEHDLKNKEK